MPQQNQCLSYSSNLFVSNFDYSEAQNILELTTTKQKQLRRQRSQVLYKQILLKRTYTLVCDLLDSDCSYSSNQIDEYQSSPLSIIDINKRKLSSDDHELKSITKKAKSLMDKCYDITNDNDVLQFLRELNSVKITARY
jgi:homoserine dehydrogenase